MWKRKDGTPKPVIIKTDTAHLAFDDEAQILTIVPKFAAPRHNKKIGDVTIPYEAIAGIREKGFDMQVIIGGRRNDITVGNSICSNPLVFTATMKKTRVSIAEKLNEIANATHTMNREFTVPPIKTAAGLPILEFGGVSLHGETITYEGKDFPITGAKAELSASTGGGGLSLGRAIVGGALAGGVGAVIGGTTGKSGTGILTITFPDGRIITATGGARNIEAGAQICNDISEWG